MSTENGQKNPFPFTGKVKWFDVEKGFGFVVCDATGKDALLHTDILYEHGQDFVHADRRITGHAVVTKSGLRLTAISEIEPEPSEDAQNPAPGNDYVAARVKWFDAQKNFGFVNVFGEPRDCLLPGTVLHKCGLNTPIVGEALAVAIGKTESGLLVRSAKNWA